ncbi:GTPase-activating of the rho rac family (LRG1) [Fusarium pseudocircinatum]|uniref:GTPase-activating of the rho rac family (LRG1) n=1 Tax=Fusarium pseudocircinatum TaxID=56676 RepID=A0A8H5PFN3_9HYPO|nr:GTPase-activating of the rho rac family (LRG1) [Fusarium pseudocircinatum]
MDPLSIASSVVGLTATCLSTCKKLHDLAGEYQDVPAVIAMICSESSIISIGLSELQMKILRRDDLAQAWASKTEIWTAFETALTGCMVVFSCLEAETRSLRSKNPGVWAKIKFIWNQDRLKELLGALRAQQSSITFLLNLLELETLSNIQKDIRKNATKLKNAASEAQSLRSSNPSVNMDPESIFDKDAANLSLSQVVAVSGNAPSELDFAFDNLVLNSQAYRRAFIKAQAEGQPPQAQDGDTVKPVNKILVQPQRNPTSLAGFSREKAISYAKDLPDLFYWLVRLLATAVSEMLLTTQYCGLYLQTGYYLPHEENGIQPKPLCKDDCIRRANYQCFKCEQHITGGFVTALGRRYHAVHFTCDLCEIVFAKESDCYQRNGGNYCMLHFCREAAYYCHACKFPIMETYSEKEDQIAKWHTSCLELSSWGLELPVSANGRRYLDSIQDQSIKGLSKHYQHLHDTRSNAIYASGLSYMKEFRDIFTQYFSLARVGRRGETYAAFKVILAMLYCLFKAAAKATTDHAGEARLQASPEVVGQRVSELLPSLLRVSFEVYLQRNDTSWDVTHPQLDLFVKTLGVSHSFELDDCYNQLPPEAVRELWKCAKCSCPITEHGFCERSSPYRKLHARCYAKITCEHEISEGGVVDDALECENCKWKKNFDIIPHEDCVLHQIWQNWYYWIRSGASDK